MIFNSDSLVALGLRVPRSFVAALVLLGALLCFCALSQSQELRFVATDVVGLEELQTE
jgi:hypothetical protein